MAVPDSRSKATYVYDNAREQAAARMEALAALYDRGTIELFGRLGLGRGWYCLEVGAGGPSIPRWLAEQAGEDGYVLVTDLEPRLLAELAGPRVEIRRHDITRDPLLGDQFDLVHARLVLQHVSDQEAAIRRMAAALKPGGWLLVEDFGLEHLPQDPAFPLPAALAKAQAASGRAQEASGRTFLSLHRLRQLLSKQGLEALDSEGRMVPYVGGGPGGKLRQANLHQLSERLLADGVSPDELAQAVTDYDDPSVVVLPPVLWAVWARRPISTGSSEGELL